MSKILKERAEVASWPYYVIAPARISSGPSLKEMRDWLKDNMKGRYKVATSFGYILLRIEDTRDNVMISLKWSSYFV